MSSEDEDAPMQGQCLLCGGRGGWWSGEFREQCPRCRQTGWDPRRDDPWFPNAGTS